VVQSLPDGDAFAPKVEEVNMKTISFTQRQSLAGDFALVALFTFFMVLAAQVRIPLPFSPVPITLQTFVLFLSIIFLKNKAYLSQGIYLVLGIMGLPIFSNGGSGLIYLLGPTGGYIIGFLLVAVVFPHFFPREKSFFKTFVFFLFAGGVYFSFGILWLVFLHHFSFTAAINAGFLPFIIGDIFKAGLASFISLRIRS
jgi:biotin transport system substrate-specific component